MKQVDLQAKEVKEIPYEVFVEAETAIQQGNLTIHPKQELVIPAELYHAMTLGLRNALENETERVVQYIPKFDQNGNFVGNQQQFVTQITEKGTQIEEVLKQSARLNILFYQKGLFIPAEKVREAFEKEQKGQEVELIPVPGMDESFTTGYWDAVVCTTPPPAPSECACEGKCEYCKCEAEAESAE